MSRWLLVALLPVGLLAVAKGQKPADTPKEEPSEIRRAAEQLVEGIDLEVQRGDKWAKAKRIERPLLLYSDDTRANDRGSVWGWGDKGRPLALFEIFQKLEDRTIWVAGITNTSGGKLRAGRSGTPWWLENDSTIEFKDIPAAPPVGSDSALRQRQMKLLAQKFTAHEIYKPGNTRYDLRRLERPLHTYQDEAEGILDGGLFTFANGTNPEIMLFIEARTDPTKAAKPVWQFAVGRSAFAELHLEYDGKEVFTSPRAHGLTGRDKPYWSSTVTFSPPTGPAKK